jgi:hypothetical protein
MADPFGVAGDTAFLRPGETASAATPENREAGVVTHRTDRRVSPRLAKVDNGKEEADESLSRVDGCFAASSLLDLTSSASSVSPDGDQLSDLNPNAPSFLQGG